MAWGKKHKDSYIKRHTEAGLCIACNSPALPGLLRCGYHTSLNKKLSRDSYLRNKERYNKKRDERRAQRKKEGKCYMCGREMNPDLDGNNLICCNCNHKKWR